MSLTPLVPTVDSRTEFPLLRNLKLVGLLPFDKCICTWGLASLKVEMRYPTKDSSWRRKGLLATRQEDSAACSNDVNRILISSPEVYQPNKMESFSYWRGIADCAKHPNGLETGFYKKSMA